jgi:hypothetical protein
VKCTLSGTPTPLGLCWRRENAVRNRQHVVVEALLCGLDPRLEPIAVPPLTITFGAGLELSSPI